MTLNLSIKKFDPRKMGDDKIVLIVGKRGSGKSTLIKNLLYHKRHIPVGVVFNATEKMNRNYGQYVPDLFIHSEYDEEVLNNIMKRQEKLIRAGKKNSNAFIVFDDMMSNASIFRSKTMKELFYNGRHFKCMVYLANQWVYGLDPSMRGQVDIVMVLREASIITRKKLYQSWFGVFDSFEAFDQVFQKLTDNYGAMVLDNTTNSTKIEDSVFWYKAQPVPSFRLGSSAFWKVHEQQYNNLYFNKDSDEDETKRRMSKAKGPRINVVKDR